MRQASLPFPEIALIAVTRVALGAGIGLLLADKLDRNARKGAGAALLLVGALTTIPLVIDIACKSSGEDEPASGTSEN